MVKVWSDTRKYYDFVDIRRIYCDAHDTEQENMEDSELGFSMFVVNTHASVFDSDFSTSVTHVDNEGERIIQFLNGGWIIV